MADCVIEVLFVYFAHVKIWIGHLTHQLRDHLRLFDIQNLIWFEKHLAQK